MATQNPIEYEGTYPLPEAQLDRFLLKMKMGYPTVEEEMEVLTRVQTSTPIETLTPVVSVEELIMLQNAVKQVYVDETIKNYIVSLANETRIHGSVYLGVSPRGSIALMRAAQSYAFIQGRDYVIPDDIQYLVKAVFAHRIILKSEAKFEGISSEIVIERILSRVSVPVQRLVK
jgi:MoxR-like ATPase